MCCQPFTFIAAQKKVSLIMPMGTFIHHRGVARDVTRVLRHYACCYKCTARGYEINNNRTGTNNGEKKAVYVVHI